MVPPPGAMARGRRPRQPPSTSAPFDAPLAPSHRDSRVRTGHTKGTSTMSDVAAAGKIVIIEYTLTNDAGDPTTQTAEYKVCAVVIEKLRAAAK